MTVKGKPHDFSAEIYENVLSVIQKNKSKFTSDAEKQLANLCGGADLLAAVSIKDDPPCQDGTNCLDCWISNWCVHKNKPLSEKLLTPAKVKSIKKTTIDIDPAQGLEDIL